MTRSLVSGARPIPWDQLSTSEKQLLDDRADPWITSVLADANRSRRRPTPPDRIDHDRSGRVLFIDGPRGAGKTSMLLTVLEGWNGDKTYRAPEAGVISTASYLRVLRPILDFDPLPRGMPLHGWLLEPWRAQAREYEKDRIVGGDSEDLSEQFANVFERAVIA